MTLTDSLSRHAAAQHVVTMCTRLQGLARLEELVRKLNDMLHNRVDANLTAIARTKLVDLPTDRTLTADEFVALQAKHVRHEAERLAIR